MKRRALAEVALLALIVGAVNYLAARHYWRGDWTRGRAFTLAPATRALVAGLDRDVEVIVFMLPSGEGANDLYQDVRELLERARRLSPRLHVEYVDIDREPERLLTVGKRYGVSRDDMLDGVIVVAAGAQSKFITRADLADYDYAAGQPPTMTTWKGEQALASALVAVTEERAPEVCFVGGHGEPALDGAEAGDYGDFAAELRRDHQAPRAITLDRDIPASCDVTVLAGPERAIPGAETHALDRLLERGGRLLVLMGPVFDARVTRFAHVGVEELLDRWGAGLGDALVIDEPHLGGSAVTFAVTSYADHPVTARLGRRRTLWSNVRAVTPRPKLGLDARPLAQSSDASWGETDLGVFHANARLGFDAGADVKGPLPLGVAVERTAGTGRGARLVVLGSAELGAAAALDDNRELLLSALAWLEERAPRVVVAPRAIEHVRLVLDDGQLGRMLVVCVGLLPLGALLLGGLVYWVRRR